MHITHPSVTSVVIPGRVNAVDADSVAPALVSAVSARMASVSATVVHNVIAGLQ